MLKTLPFNALRTLEAVVRLRGFGRAAEELNVTQSAVSQHVKLLEDWLGHRLLIRRSRQTIPTKAGERLAAATAEGYGGIERICDELRGATRAQSNGILVAAPPGFAFVWLLPRLLDFDDENPEIEVSLSTDPQDRATLQGEADVFITYSAGGFPGLHAERLLSEEMSPVCAPSLAGALTDIADLADHIILQDISDAPNSQPHWDFWAREVDVTLPRFTRTRKYGQANLVVQATKRGLGVAMGRGPLVYDAIADGSLVHPFPHVAQSQYAYWLVCPHDALRRPEVQAFRDWVHAEARRMISD